MVTRPAPRLARLRAWWVGKRNGSPNILRDGVPSARTERLDLPTRTGSSVASDHDPVSRKTEGLYGVSVRLRCLGHPSSLTDPWVRAGTADGPTWTTHSHPCTGRKGPLSLPLLPLTPSRSRTSPDPVGRETGRQTSSKTTSSPQGRSVSAFGLNGRTGSSVPENPIVTRTPGRDGSGERKGSRPPTPVVVETRVFGNHPVSVLFQRSGDRRNEMDQEGLPDGSRHQEPSHVHTTRPPTGTVSRSPSERVGNRSSLRWVSVLGRDDESIGTHTEKRRGSESKE